MTHSCWIEISQAALAHNFRAIQNLVGPEVRLINVVKANAYGCGAVECSRILAEAGATYFAVTRLEEAVPLREAGMQQPILLLAPVVPGQETDVVNLDLTASISDWDDAARLAEAGKSAGKTPRAHVKVDTGMGRFGMAPEQIKRALDNNGLPGGVEYEGLFTHFPEAGAADTTATKRQFTAFEQLVQHWRSLRPLPLAHAANSSALVRFPEMRLDAVRPGTLLYGQFPSPLISQAGKTAGVELKDPFQAKARIVALKKVAAGTPIGYGSEWKAPKASTIAILACGYADGLTIEPRARTESPLDAVKGGLERAARLMKNPNAGRMLTVRGQKVPLVGRVAMQTCALDVTEVPGVALGDEVIVPMRRVSAGGHLARVYV